MGAGNQDSGGKEAANKSFDKICLMTWIFANQYGQRVQPVGKSVQSVQQNNISLDKKLYFCTQNAA
jgi:hypothetical protein